ncbi:MAG: threonine/serine exporter family protein [Deltaproteobacteria bacterium]|nr:threonine/serine exporter family protein [Deltaproteobacteria bacterium]
MEAEIGFVLALARALHRFGTPAHRLEEALANVCASLGLEAETFTTPTAIIISFGKHHDLRTRLMRVEGGELDMGKLAQIDALGDQVIEKAITPTDARARLDAILAAPKQFGRALSTLVHGVTSAGLAVFFGGTLQDVLLAGAIGLTLGLLAQLIARSTDQTRVFELVGAAFAAFAAGVMSSWSPRISPSLVTLAALVILLPGMSLTVAMTELATRNLIAGTARLMSAVIVLLELVVGVALGERAATALVHVRTGVPLPLPEYANWIALVASSLGVAVLVQAQLRAFGWILGACVVGYVGSRYGTAWLGPQMGVLVGAFALGVLSNLYARQLHRPAQVVSVPAVLLLVPGSMGLRGMTSLLDKETLTGIETVFAMFIVATAIVAGLLIANAVFAPRRSL